MIYSNIEDLRRDAIARTNEMYSRVKRQDSENKDGENNWSETQSSENNDSENINKSSAIQTPKKYDLSVQNILGENADRILLLIIMYLLYKEKADYKILCALLYIFL